MTIHLSDELQKKVAAKVVDGGFSSVDEYVETLLLEDCDQEEYDEELEKLLLQRLDSGPGIELTPEYRKQLIEDLKRPRVAPES